MKLSTVRNTLTALLVSTSMMATVSPALANDLRSTVSASEQAEAVQELLRRLKLRNQNPSQLDVVHKRDAMSTDPYSQSYTIDRSGRIRVELFFKAGESALSDNGHFVVELIARALRRPDLRGTRFVLGGHTDASGDKTTNERLSAARAATVKRILVSHHGIDPDRLVDIGFGEQEAHNKADPLGAKHRRLELVPIVTSVAQRRPHRKWRAHAATLVRTPAYNRYEAADTSREWGPDQRKLTPWTY